jgi:hypothetical protein
MADEMASDSDVLRQAAARMRERAEAATPGPWVGEFSGKTGPVVMDAESRNALDHLAQCKHYRAQFDAEHIASWHPAVALAVADWLEREADWWDQNGADWYAAEQALAVARAYLGEGS